MHRCGSRLRDAVQLALHENPQVQVANLNVAESQQDQNMARAGLLPQASFQAYEHTQRLAVAPLFGMSTHYVPSFPGHLGPYQVD
jgi:outer membrane protein